MGSFEFFERDRVGRGVVRFEGDVGATFGVDFSVEDFVGGEGGDDLVGEVEEAGEEVGEFGLVGAREPRSDAGDSRGKNRKNGGTWSCWTWRGI